MSLNLYVCVLVCRHTLSGDWQGIEKRDQNCTTKVKEKQEKFVEQIRFFSDSGFDVAVLCGHLDSVYVIIVGSNMELKTQHVVRQEHTINHVRCTPVITLVNSLQFTVAAFPFSIKR